MAKPVSTTASTDRLLEAALDQFSRLGFEGASTRAIAEAAGTAMSSITYHYGGKDGLYLAVADHIASQCGVLFENVLISGSANAMSDHDIREGIDELVSILVRLMLNDRSAPWASFIAREQLKPGPAYDVLYDRLLVRVCGRLIDFILQLGRGRWTSAEVRLKALAVLGQARMVCTAAEMSKRVTGRDPGNADDMAAIEHAARQNWRVILALGEEIQPELVRAAS
ncbi:CerR family C-terminal domain-containing protein [Paracoccus nototheniae]|uniref:CerR family C-terminal domain-containing protein n=1 Tax=Paracoccus nototheniae TaxID=2489002 RepID=A0ABW4DVU8_9RHOB|nr:CerR family C-terminal domain-containing protein [Paracoccus nototheniae]